MLTMAFLLVGIDPTVSASDLERFPAEASLCQVKRSREQVQRLRWLAGIRGWEDGRWEEALREMEFRLRAWEALREAYLDTSKGGRWRRACLERLKEHIGPVRYLKGWAPPALPDDSSFAPLGVPDPPSFFDLFLRD